MPVQLTFPCRTEAFIITPMDDYLPITYGAYEAVMIVKENGYEVGGTMKLHSCMHPVTNVELVDGTILHFPVPFYQTNRGHAQCGTLKNAAT